MGFYFSKSVSVGPFRFNLSKSGVGISTGIKGFRIGTGPRGNYIQMGRGGVYFRQTLPGAARPHSIPQISTENSSDIKMEEVGSGSVGNMVDSSSANLLNEINTKSKR